MLVFNQSHLCDVDRMMAATNDWLGRHLAFETR
jgi:hypothetical protein